VVKVLRRTVLPLILGFMLALQPVTYAVAEEDSPSEEAAIGTTVNVPLGVDVIVVLDIPTVIGAQATAVNDAGVGVPINPGELELTISSTIDSLVLPISLPGEQDIESFSDPDTGITIEGDDIVIPLRDQDDDDILFIKATKTTKESSGTESTFALQDVVLTSIELTSKMSSADEDVGTIGVSFEVVLDVLPEGVIVNTTVTKDADPECHGSFVQAIRGEIQDTIKDTAYVLEVEKTNLENGTHLGMATITMKVGRAWAEAYGYDNIAILRCGDEGGSQRLDAEHIGFDGDNAIFQAESPLGLSFFGLVALGADQAPNPWYIVGGVGGAVLVSGLLLFFILRRRRIRDSMLTSSWPTGLRPEDWNDPDLK